MSPPTTRFVTTSDGVKIAYTRVGDGPPVVFASNFRGDVHTYRTSPVGGKQVGDQPTAVARNPTDRLAAFGWEVIHHDGRGMGSSDRLVADWSLEGRVPWPRYAKSSDQHMDFGSEIRVGTGLHASSLDAFDSAFAVMRRQRAGGGR